MTRRDRRKPHTVIIVAMLGQVVHLVEYNTKHGRARAKAYLDACRKTSPGLERWWTMRVYREQMKGGQR